jgi:signal peptidase II
MKFTDQKYFRLLFIAGAVIILDQWTKWFVRENIPLNGSWLPESMLWLAPYARFVHIQNGGASFGMFQNGNILFSLLAFLVIGGILYYISKLEHVSGLTWLGAGLYLGCAVGNLIDRLTIGKVTDFISVGSFYIFNVADASINVGVVVLLISLWLHEKEKSGAAPISGGDAA